MLHFTRLTEALCKKSTVQSNTRVKNQSSPLSTEHVVMHRSRTRTHPPDMVVDAAHDDVGVAMVVGCYI